jgi:thymidine kinase
MPNFKIFTGPMFGGKTTRLLGAIERDILRKHNVKSFKPKIDDRYAANEITTHIGASHPAIPVSSGADIVQYVENMTALHQKVDSVAVDEFFMIPNVAAATISLFQSGINIYVSTLQLNSVPIAYTEVSKILPWATEIVVCPAVCTICGDDAYYTYKKGGDPNAAIEIGGSDLYEPRCFSHFFK